jgi:putative sigma-54 modulation protein
MKASYTFKHLDHSEALLNYTGGKLDEVGKFLLKEGYGNVYYSKQKNEFCVEISVNTKHRYFKASAFHTDVYAAVDAAVDKLEKQFLKLRKTLKDHKNFDQSKSGQLEHVNERIEYNVRYRKAA